MEMSSTLQINTKESLDGMNGIPAPRNGIPKRKNITPYSLYMRENYVNLKQQLQDDKKAIFSKCHEMWEQESAQVKSMYDRKAAEENERTKDDTIYRTSKDTETTGRHRTKTALPDTVDEEGRNNNLSMKNQTLSLDSAAKFAALVASHHIDTSTRDIEHVDISQLLEKAIGVSRGHEEI